MTEDLDAVVLALPPNSWPQPEDERITSLSGWVTRQQASRFNSLDAILDQYRPAEPFYYFSFCGVRPGYERKGLGKALIERCLSTPEAAGVRCPAEAGNPSGAGLMKSCDFHVTAVVAPNGSTDASVTFMTREGMPAVE